MITARYSLSQTYEILQMPYYALYYYQQAVKLRPDDSRMGAPWVNATSLTSLECLRQRFDITRGRWRPLRARYRARGKSSPCSTGEKNPRGGTLLHPQFEAFRQGRLESAEKHEALEFLATLHEEQRLQEAGVCASARRFGPGETRGEGTCARFTACKVCSNFFNTHLE